MKDPLIRIERVSKAYQRGKSPLVVLEELDLEVERGGFCALMGPSGSGKTTLLNLIGGLDQPDSGRLIVAGADLGALSGAELARWRADHVGFVFQAFNLLPVLSAQQNVELPLLLSPLSRRERREHAHYALELVGLADHAAHRPRELSGGQEQRVAIARAIVTDPALILADEPTGDLDRASADGVLDLLARLNAEFEKTVVMVTHDPLAAARARRTIELDKGALAAPAAARS
jgi:putative ABC transport system ATP-binding protein